MAVNNNDVGLGL